MHVLQHLAQIEGMSLSDLAKATQQSPATLYRVLTTLAQHKVTEFNEATQTWHVGPGAFSIGSSFLRRSTGETANLGVPSGDFVMFVSQVETHATIRAFFPPGTQSAMHSSGIGKALLAYYPPERLKKWARNQRLEAFTAKTIITMEALQAELSRIRETGLSVDDEERTQGMRCIAAPVFNSFAEPVAGLSVSGPTSRMDEGSVARFGALVRAAAASVTEAVGGQMPG